MIKQIAKFSGMLVYILLALCLSIVTLCAADGYNAAQSDADAGASARVCGMFLRTRVRQGDAAGGVFILDGRLNIAENYDGMDCVASIYYHDGWLMEQLTLPGVVFEPEMGDKIMRCSGFSADVSAENILRYEIEFADQEPEIGSVLLRSEHKL